jgi:protein TonB
MRHASRTGQTANDRLKATFGARLSGSLAMAAVLHFAVLAYGPEIAVAAPGGAADPIKVVDMPPEVEIPPPPEEPQRPAVPILSPDVEIDPDLTIAPTTLEDAPLEPPRPGLGSGVDVSGPQYWTPHEVRPELRNAREYLRVLETRYPAMLRDAGVGGTVLLWVHVSENGAVVETRVAETSRHPQLDRVAEEVMREVARFRPALNRDQRVPVWVQIPVTFEVR